MSHLKLNERIHFGKCTGKRPIDLIKSKSEVDIRYLLWLREQKKGKFPAYFFDNDLHHALDALIRSNVALYGKYEQCYTIEKYNLWRAEKRIQIEKEKKKKEAELAARELRHVVEEQLFKVRAAKKEEKALEKLRQEKERAEIEALNGQMRTELYGKTWGAW